MNRLSNRALVQELMHDPEFKQEYDALGPEFDLIEKMLIARNKSGFTQAEVEKNAHCKKKGRNDAPKRAHG